MKAKIFLFALIALFAISVNAQDDNKCKKCPKAKTCKVENRADCKKADCKKADCKKADCKKADCKKADCKKTDCKKADCKKSECKK